MRYIAIGSPARRVTKAMDDLFHLLSDDVPDTRGVRQFFNCTSERRHPTQGFKLAWWARVRRGTAYAYVRHGNVNWSHRDLAASYPGYVYVTADVYDARGIVTLHAHPHVRPTPEPPDPRDLTRPLQLKAMLRVFKAAV